MLMFDKILEFVENFQLPLSGSQRPRALLPFGTRRGVHFQLPLSGSPGHLFTNAHVCPFDFQLPLSGSPEEEGQRAHGTPDFQLPLSGSHACLQTDASERKCFQLPLSGSLAYHLRPRFAKELSPFNSLSRDHSLLRDDRVQVVHAFNSLSRDHGDVLRSYVADEIEDLSTPSLGITRS